jgi:hypothetical protein
MFIRTLNEAGINEFRNQMLEIKSRTRTEFDNSFLFDKNYSESFNEEVEIEYSPFTNKKEISEYLSIKLQLENRKELYYNIGLWTWLSAFYFHLVCPKGNKGIHNIKAEARYILADPKNWRRYYRHLLACPARLYCELGELAQAFLASEIHIWGDFHEQLTAYQEIATNKPLIKAANILYWDPVAKKLKKGAGSKGVGTPRRFSDIVGQFELTYDLNAMVGEQILQLFPEREFKKWTSVA